VLAEFATDACVGGIMGATTGSFFGAIANTLFNAVDLAINEGAVADSSQTIVRAAVDAGTDAAQTAAATEAALCGTPVVAVGVVRSVRALPRLLRKFRPGVRASFIPTKGGRSLPFGDADRITEINKTLDQIELGGPFPHKKDGTVFRNDPQVLPPGGNYREYTVDTPGAPNRAQRRIVQDVDTGNMFYTDDHYETFIQIDPTKR